jgi:hypothetical protein
MKLCVTIVIESLYADSTLLMEYNNGKKDC